MDVGFLQETKLMQGIHIRNGMGYDIWKMEAESWHEGGGSSGMESGKGMAGG